MEAFLREALVKVKKQARGCLAPELCFQAVRAAAERPFAEGVRRERELFQVLLTSGQARALQYAFFAERAVRRWSTPSGASWSSAAPQPVRKAAVIGKDSEMPGWALSTADSSAGRPQLTPFTSTDTPHPLAKLSLHWEAPNSDGNSHAARLAPDVSSSFGKISFSCFRDSFVWGP